MKLHYIANFRLYEPLKIPFVKFQANTGITTLETETKKYFVNTLNTYWSNTALYSKTTIKVFAFCLDEKQATLNHVETQQMSSFYPKFFHRNNVKYSKSLCQLAQVSQLHRQKWDWSYFKLYEHRDTLKPV